MEGSWMMDWEKKLLKDAIDVAILHYEKSARYRKGMYIWMGISFVLLLIVVTQVSWIMRY